MLLNMVRFKLNDSNYVTGGSTSTKNCYITLMHRFAPEAFEHETTNSQLV